MPTYNKKTSEKYKQGKERPVHKKKKETFFQRSQKQGKRDLFGKKPRIF